MSEVPDVQSIITDMVAKMKKLEKDNADLNKEQKKLIQGAANHDLQMKQMTELAETWKDTAEMHEKELKSQKARAPLGLEMFQDFFTVMFEAALYDLLHKYVEWDQAIVKALLTLSEEDQAAMKKYRQGQDMNFKKKIKQIQEVSK
jgi:hypothetical protein